MSNNPIDTLAELFEDLPGIGPRQARRFVQHLLMQAESSRIRLADTIRALGPMTASCPQCFRWFVKDEGERPVACGTCTSPSRDRGVLFVLEKDADITNVERGGFRGRYFVLGGTIPLGESDPERTIRMRPLRDRVARDGEAGVLKEVILGLSATTEGDHTRLQLQETLRSAAETFGIKITALGRGLSTGSELEYADPDTIASALSARR